MAVFKKLLHKFLVVCFFVLFYYSHEAMANEMENCFQKMKRDEDIECCFLQNGTVKPITKSTHMCCNGTETRHARNLRCCQHNTDDMSILYDSTFFKCCDGQIQRRSNDDEECCGKNLYNKKKEHCCPIEKGVSISYQIYEISPEIPKCPIVLCNNAVFNLQKYLCCDDELVPAIANHSCCGSRSFDLNTQVCCDGVRHYKQPGMQKCCGKKYMNEDEKCCGGEVLQANEKCCNKRSYNSSLSLCTADSEIVPIGTPLCNDMKYDPDKEICCGFFKMIKQNPNDNSCCKPKGHRLGVTYNNKNMTCRGGRLYSTVKCDFHPKPDEYTCCNGFVYNQPAKNSVCCDGRAEWFQPGSNQESCRTPLCDNMWYDDNEYDCCDDKLINPNKCRCIEGKAYKYWSSGDNNFSDLRPCGSYAITKTTNCCANIMPYRSTVYKCPFSNFGDQKPIKPKNFPFWPIIKCRSKKKKGRITNVEIIGTMMTIIIKEKGTRKQYAIEVSNTQRRKIMVLKNRKSSVDVYFEKIDKDVLFLGEYGAIVFGRERREKISKSVCEQINKYFQSHSS